MRGKTPSTSRGRCVRGWLTAWSFLPDQPGLALLRHELPSKATFPKAPGGAGTKTPELTPQGARDCASDPRPVGSPLQRFGHFANQVQQPELLVEVQGSQRSRGQGEGLDRSRGIPPAADRPKPFGQGSAHCSRCCIRGPGEEPAARSTAAGADRDPAGEHLSRGQAIQPPGHRRGQSSRAEGEFWLGQREADGGEQAASGAELKAGISTPSSWPSRVLSHGVWPPLRHRLDRFDQPPDKRLDSSGRRGEGSG